MRPSAEISVHPTTHDPNGLPERQFDVICIGSGWAGRIAAARLVAAGLTALIIEDELLGGDCPFWACVPSKVLLRPAEVLNDAASVGGARERILPGASVDADAVFKRRNMFTAGWNDGAVLVPMVESAGVHIARGVGSLAGTRKVTIDRAGQDPIYVEARLAVVIATGSDPIFPDIPGLKESDCWTPRDATSSNSVPEHLIVMGAGAVGTEMATAYSGLGAKVTLISSSSEILPGMDPEAGKVVRESMQSAGVVVKTGTRVNAVKRQGKDQITVSLSNGEEVNGSELLVAAGRKGKHELLNLASVGAQAKGKYIPVDDSLSVKTAEQGWLYAVGDVNGRALLTHTSKYHGRIVANAIIARSKGAGVAGTDWTACSASADKFAVPQVVFTSPPVASVGFTRTSAKAAGLGVREITAPFLSLGGRIASDKPVDGWAQWIVDSEERLIGATFVGHGAADVLHASTVAVVGGLKLDRLVHAIPSFPTVSEVYLNLIDAAGF